MSLSADELEALRPGAAGSVPQDPAFARVAGYIFSDGDRRTFPHAGVPTLLNAPAIRIAPGEKPPADLQAVVEKGGRRSPLPPINRDSPRRRR
jgi:hypothetical protein